jgi:hypothetical protein
VYSVSGNADGEGEAVAAGALVIVDNGPGTTTVADIEVVCAETETTTRDSKIVESIQRLSLGWSMSIILIFFSENHPVGGTPQKPMVLRVPGRGFPGRS